jgi:hypothetical protein
MRRIFRAVCPVALRAIVLIFFGYKYIAISLLDVAGDAKMMPHQGGRPFPVAVFQRLDDLQMFLA